MKSNFIIVGMILSISLSLSCSETPSTSNTVANSGNSNAQSSIEVRNTNVTAANAPTNETISTGNMATGNAITREDFDKNRAQSSLDRKNDPLMENVHNVIYQWSDSENYTLSTPLKNLWDKRYRTIPYNPRGINRLIGEVRNHNYFRDCHLVKNLDGKFSSTGINTVGGLYMHLTPCKK